MAQGDSQTRFHMLFQATAAGVKVTHMAQSTNVERKLRQLDNEVHAIYDLLDAIAATQALHSNRFDELARTLAAHTRILAEHSQILAEHSRTLGEHSRILGQHGHRLDAHDGRFDHIDTKFDRVDAKLRAHDGRFDRMDTKLDTIVELLGGPAA